MMVAASSAANNDKISFEDFVAIQKEWDKERVGLIRASPLHPFNHSHNTQSILSPSQAMGGPKGGSMSKRGTGGLGQAGGNPYAVLKMAAHPRMYVSAMTAPGMNSATAGAVTSSNILASPGSGQAAGGGSGLFAGISSHHPSPAKTPHNYSFGSKMARGEAKTALIAQQQQTTGTTGMRMTAPLASPSTYSDEKKSAPPQLKSKGSAPLGGATPSSAGAASAAGGSVSPRNTLHHHSGSSSSLVHTQHSKTAAGQYPTFSTFGGSSGSGRPASRSEDRKHARSPSLGANSGAASGGVGTGSRPGSAVGFRGQPLSTKLGAHHKLAFAANLK